MDLTPASRAEWEAWLEDAHHCTPDGVWLRVPRAKSGHAGPTYADALEVALCFGWIDGQKGVGDETHWRQRFLPRRPRSRWSKVNRAKAEALIEAEAMRPAGLREVERARADGRWDAAYDSPSTATVPEDFTAALSEAGAANFAAMTSQNRYAMLFRIQEAKRPATRAARIEKFAAMCERNEQIHP
jgi:uncharacterized protein YdeI (YjbR/CyaY-like superfamily)